MSADDIANTITAFATAATRADAARFTCIEVYAAHGFLLHQFYSPLCNTRNDRYGGDFVGRTRLTREVARAIRAVWPADKILAFRLSATDWLESGWSIDDSVRLAQELRDDGVDLIDCSSGGIGGPHPLPRFPLGPAFQAELAATVKAGASVATMAVGFIWQATVANKLIADGKCDLVALGRELLNDPNWALHADGELALHEPFALWKPEFGWWLEKRERAMRKLGMRE